MKKILTIILAMLILCGLAIPVLAAEDYVPSPSMKDVPGMSYEGGNGTAVLTVYSLKNTDMLSSDQLAVMETAYDSIRTAENVTDLCKGLSDMAKHDKMDPDKLVISDIFDIICSEEDGGKFKIELTFDKDLNVVALLHFTDGKWEVVESTIKNGVLTFESDNFSPFAFVVYTGSTEKQPLIWLWIILIVLFLVAVSVAAYYIVKKNKVE